MAKTCQNCGNVFEDSANICPRCGMQYVQPQYDQQQYQPYQQSTYQQPTYQPYQQQYAEQPMTLGQWVGTILLTQCLGIISIILLFVWAFSDSTPTSKKNYCRAMLIFEAIMIGVVILMMIMIFSLAGTAAGLGNISY